MGIYQDLEACDWEFFKSHTYNIFPKRRKPLKENANIKIVVDYEGQLLDSACCDT